MQIELSPHYVIAAASLAVTIQGVIVGVALMIRGTAKDLARESQSREEQSKATNARLADLEAKDHGHSVALATTTTRIDTLDRSVQGTATTVAGHATAISALEAWREHEERRRRRR